MFISVFMSVKLTFVDSGAHVSEAVSFSRTPSRKEAVWVGRDPGRGVRDTVLCAMRSPRDGVGGMFGVSRVAVWDGCCDAAAYAPAWGRSGRW
jgi:hypothetical protein